MHVHVPFWGMRTKLYKLVVLVYFLDERMTKTEEELASIYLDNLGLREKTSGLNVILTVQNKRIAKHCGSAKIILDVGAGTGNLLFDLMRFSSANYAIGLDFSKVGFKKAKRHSNQIDFVLGDARNLPIRKECIDFISCKGVLHHLSDPQEALHETFRVLAENGTLVIREFNMLNYFSRFIRWFSALFGYKIEMTTFKNYHRSELQNFLKNAGYLKIKCEFDTFFLWQIIKFFLPSQAIFSKIIYAVEKQMVRKNFFSYLAQGILFVSKK